MRLTQVVNLVKLFGVNLLMLFGKLDHFINISSIFSIEMKRPSLQKRVRKFTPKMPYEICPIFTIFISF